MWICVYTGTVGGSWERCASPSAFLTRIGICSLHKVKTTPCAWMSFYRSTAVTPIAVSQSTPAYAKPCPSRALGQRSLGLVERPCHTRSTNPTVNLHVHPTGQREGKLYVLKKATTPCTKMSLILPRIGPRLRNIYTFHSIPEIFSE